MSCANDTALGALDRGHVRWEQLHPAVRHRLECDGHQAADFTGVAGRPEHQRTRQHGER